jgi:hypothetical protein
MVVDLEQFGKAIQNQSEGKNDERSSKRKRSKKSK